MPHRTGKRNAARHPRDRGTEPGDGVWRRRGAAASAALPRSTRRSAKPLAMVQRPLPDDLETAVAAAAARIPPLAQVPAPAAAFRPRPG